MRVFHVYHDFAPARGGIEDFLADLTRAQAAAGWDVVVLTANARALSETAVVDGVRVIRAASYGRCFTPLCPGWFAQLRRLATQADIVHLHLPCPLGEWALAAAKPRRLIVSLHNDYVRPRAALWLHRPFQRAALARADLILTSSDDYADSLPILREWRGKVRSVPYGIDLRRNAPAARAAADEPVLFAGRLCYYKGVEVLLDAARHMQGRIAVVGDGPWRKRLQAQAQRLALGDRVRFLGALCEDALLERMQASRVFVFPSTERSEAFGIAQLKAMACGLPVVSSNLPGVRWLNRNGESGWCVPARDARALAGAVNALLADEALRTRLAAGARRRAAQFPLQRMVDETEALFREVLSLRALN